MRDLKDIMARQVPAWTVDYRDHIGEAVWLCWKELAAVAPLAVLADDIDANFNFPVPQAPDTQTKDEVH